MTIMAEAARFVLRADLDGVCANFYGGFGPSQQRGTVKAWWSSLKW
jgi:hypothetical protein